MTSVESRLAALFERKAAEAGRPRPLSSKAARSAARARFVRKTGAPMLAVTGICAAVGFAGASLVATGRGQAPAANRPDPRLSGTNGAREWRLTAVADGSEHCLIVRFSYEGREIDTSHNCGVHVGDVHPRMGPGVTTAEAGGGMLAVLGQVGPDVDAVSVESAAGRETTPVMPIDWDTPPETGFYVFFLPDDVRTAVLSTYDDGELIRETPLKFVARDAHIAD